MHPGNSHQGCRAADPRESTPEKCDEQPSDQGLGGVEGKLEVGIADISLSTNWVWINGIIAIGSEVLFFKNIPPVQRNLKQTISSH